MDPCVQRGMHPWDREPSNVLGRCAQEALTIQTNIDAIPRRGFEQKEVTTSSELEALPCSTSTISDDGEEDPPELPLMTQSNLKTTRSVPPGLSCLCLYPHTNIITNRDSQKPSGSSAWALTAMLNRSQPDNAALRDNMQRGSIHPGDRASSKTRFLFTRGGVCGHCAMISVVVDNTDDTHGDGVSQWLAGRKYDARGAGCSQGLAEGNDDAHCVVRSHGPAQGECDVSSCRGDVATHMSSTFMTMLVHTCQNMYRDCLPALILVKRGNTLTRWVHHNVRAPFR